MKRIARFRLKDRFKSVKKHAVLTSLDDPDACEEPASPNNATSRYNCKKLLGALNLLPKLERFCFILVKLRGRTREEAADRLRKLKVSVRQVGYAVLQAAVKLGVLREFTSDPAAGEWCRRRRKNSWGCWTNCPPGSETASL